ncbi:hypothetical protein M231_00369 [Tremella mesenterica]|uniref:NADH:ubiquinone oxidoreductase intermediate-associated protein 30 domain-containing protein n=1 Tax=Tremella mesenterica TaxID=5217 RepID=A0A4Q1BW42_TREME|nr:hypothetical protein M231_00369 [Tremella mesenterica]
MILLIQVYVLLFFSVVCTEVVNAGKVNTNSQRLQRGLPPRAPVRRYNATSTRHAPARRSAPVVGYMQASPVSASKRNFPERAGTPYDTISYVGYDSTKGWLQLSTDPTSAASFHFTNGAGTEQDVQLWVSDAQHGYAVSGIWHWLGGTERNMNSDTYLSIVFTSGSQKTPSQSYGSFSQSAIWTTPSSWPQTVRIFTCLSRYSTDFSDAEIDVGLRSGQFILGTSAIFWDNDYQVPDMSGDASGTNGNGVLNEPKMGEARKPGLLTAKALRTSDLQTDGSSRIKERGMSSS